jgi:transcription elongation factor GreB
MDDSPLYMTSDFRFQTIDIRLDSTTPMSKAFTRESDDEADEVSPLPRPLLPPGVKNYITPSGAQRTRDELAELCERNRQLPCSTAGARQAESPQPGSDQRKIEARIRQLQQILESVVVTEPPAMGRDVVRFGATVTIRRASNEETVYRIVGVDETDVDRGYISWLSPLARQLLGRRPGERVGFKVPAGDEELQILVVSYE